MLRSFDNSHLSETLCRCSPSSTVGCHVFDPENFFVILPRILDSIAVPVFVVWLNFTNTETAATNPFKPPLSSTFHWAEALQRFCIRFEGVVALVSVSEWIRGALSNGYEYWVVKYPAGNFFCWDDSMWDWVKVNPLALTLLKVINSNSELNQESFILKCCLYHVVLKISLLIKKITKTSFKTHIAVKPPFCIKISATDFSLVSQISSIAKFLPQRSSSGLVRMETKTAIFF